jgi:preprotein translocase subunit SecD
MFFGITTHSNITLRAMDQLEVQEYFGIEEDDEDFDEIPAYIIYQTQNDKSLNDLELEGVLDALNSKLRALGITEAFVMPLDGTHIFIDVPESKDEDANHINVIEALGTTIDLTVLSRIFIPQALGPNGIRQGLDLAGGSVIVYEAQVAGTPDKSDMDSAVAMLQARLTSLGYTEATVAIQGDKRLRLEIPAVANPEAAMAELGATANLLFTDGDGNILMEGRHIDTAQAGSRVNERGQRENYVLLNFTSEGSRTFYEATSKVAAMEDNRLYILMDPEMDPEDENVVIIPDFNDQRFISAPSVSQAIDGDTAEITGQFDMEHASWLSNMIRIGRLPFTLRDVETQSIGATLGEACRWNRPPNHFHNNAVNIQILRPNSMPLTYGIYGRIPICNESLPNKSKLAWNRRYHLVNRPSRRRRYTNLRKNKRGIKARKGHQISH